jgi:plastocyanin domain-containing protein
MYWGSVSSDLLYIGFGFQKKKAVRISNDGVITIKVKDGVYSPSVVEISQDKPITLRFIREDASPCAEAVVFNQLDKSLPLPLGKPVDITLKIKIPGEYAFTCQMSMYQGKLIVK